MSDFIYSSKIKPQGELTRHIQSIYHNDPPEVFEYHGAWGSLGVSRNLYNGFQPLETREHIFVIIGGPVLCFRDNMFLTGRDPVAGTKSIYERWLDKKIQWDEDLSGPFVVLVLDKERMQINCVTDLMMFIPVYKYPQNGQLMLATHVDALARAAGEGQRVDYVSVVDFILNDVVTYPYTTYTRIRQLHPASTHDFTAQAGNREVQVQEPKIYWLPREENPYSNINEAARDLRHGLTDYINRITEGMDHVAQFLSAGEDSRSVAGMLPQRLKRDAFIFLDSMNREGHIARKVAHAYSANFFPQFRNQTHYLDILPEATDLIGNGHQYLHAHSLWFHKTCELNHYSGVFGGYLADSLLKACYTNKIPKRIPFLPQCFIPGQSRTKLLANAFFKTDILRKIDLRRRSHFNNLLKYRKKTVHEWFVLWPATMRVAIPNLYSNRRLFRSYELFMCKEAVKVSSSVPTSWKLNRRLFYKAFQSYLKPSKWIIHAKGYLPYFPWWVNSPLQSIIWTSQQICYRTGITKTNQGSWADYKRLMRSSEWIKAVENCSSGFDMLRRVTSNDDLDQLFNGNKLRSIQKLNMLQTCYFWKRLNES